MILIVHSTEDLCSLQNLSKNSAPPTLQSLHSTLVVSSNPPDAHAARHAAHAPEARGAGSHLRLYVRPLCPLHARTLSLTQNSES